MVIFTFISQLPVGWISLLKKLEGLIFVGRAAVSALGLIRPVFLLEVDGAIMSTANVRIRGGASVPISGGSQIRRTRYMGCTDLWIWRYQ